MECCQLSHSPSFARWLAYLAQKQASCCVFTNSRSFRTLRMSTSSQHHRPGGDTFRTLSWLLPAPNHPETLPASGVGHVEWTKHQAARSTASQFPILYWNEIDLKTWLSNCLPRVCVAMLSCAHYSSEHLVCPSGGYIHARDVRWYVCVCVCACIWLHNLCRQAATSPAAEHTRAHSIRLLVKVDGCVLRCY